MSLCTNSGVFGKVYSSCSNQHRWSTVDCFSMWTFWSKMKVLLLSLSHHSAPLFSPPQSSRSLTRPTCSTPCAPPPTTTLCCVSAGGATGDTLAPLPAWELNPRTAAPSETRPRRCPEFNGTFQELLRLFQQLRVSPRESWKHEQWSHVSKQAQEWHQEETDPKNNPALENQLLDFIFISHIWFHKHLCEPQVKQMFPLVCTALVTLWIIGPPRLSSEGAGQSFSRTLGTSSLRRRCGSSGFFSPTRTDESPRLRTNLSD